MLADVRLLLLWMALGVVTGCYANPRRPDGGEGLLPVGSEAPDVEAYDVSGASIRLSALRSHPVIVYFYPRDGTPGCTEEACAFRDAWNEFRQAGVVVIG